MTNKKERIAMDYRPIDTPFTWRGKKYVYRNEPVDVETTCKGCVWQSKCQKRKVIFAKCYPLVREDKLFTKVCEIK